MATLEEQIALAGAAQEAQDAAAAQAPVAVPVPAMPTELDPAIAEQLANPKQLAMPTEDQFVSPYKPTLGEIPGAIARGAGRIAEQLVPPVLTGAPEAIPAAPMPAPAPEPANRALAQTIMETPSEAEIEAQAEPIRQANAATQADARVADEQAQKVAAINKQADANVEKYEAKSLPELLNSGPWYSRIGAVLAVLAGGYSQGLTGSQRNPAVDIINQSVEQAAVKRKLANEEKEALREAEFKKQKMRLDEMIAKGQVARDNAFVQKTQGEMNDAILDARNKQLKAIQLKQGGVDDPELFDKEEKPRSVRLPNGKYQLAHSKFDKEALEKVRASTEPAIDAIKRLEQYSKNANRMSLEDRAKIGTELQLLLGQLREPILGPGTMNNGEYDRLQATVGNPNKVFALKDIEMKKLGIISNKLSTDLRKSFFRAGINVPKTQEQSLVDKLEAKGYPRAVIEKAIQKMK